MKESKVSDHFIRLGMSEDMRMRVEAWRMKCLQETGRVPSFSEAIRQLVDKGLDHDKTKD
jgi:hypothetical protein